MENGQANGCKDCGGTYILIEDEEDPRLAMFNKPLPCCGCGIGWCSLLLGFVCPLIWYYAAILYLCSYYHRDPRERSGLAANAIAITSWTVGFTTDGIESSKYIDPILFRRREQGRPNKMGLRRKITVDVSLQSTA